MPTKKVGFLIKQVHILQEQKLNKKFNRFDLTGAQMFTIINLFKAREKGEKLTPYVHTFSIPFFSLSKKRS